MSQAVAPLQHSITDSPSQGFAQSHQLPHAASSVQTIISRFCHRQFLLYLILKSCSLCAYFGSKTHTATCVLVSNVCPFYCREVCIIIDPEALELKRFQHMFIQIRFMVSYLSVVLVMSAVDTNICDLDSCQSVLFVQSSTFRVCFLFNVTDSFGCF